MPRRLLHRRRRAPRRGRLLLDHGPRRRRAERRRPSPRHDGDRERAGAAIPTVAEAAVVGRPDELKGQAHRRLRHARAGQHADRRRCKKELQGARRQGDRRLRPARRHPLHRRAAEDPQRQDHAPPAARHRRRQGDARRHDDARRLLGAREAARGGRVARRGAASSTNTLIGPQGAARSRASPGHVGIYWCGVTVYVRSHIGHARALITADVLVPLPARPRARASPSSATSPTSTTRSSSAPPRRASRPRRSPSARSARFDEDVAWLGCLPPDARAARHRRTSPR